MLDLPPPYTLVIPAKAEDAFAHACAIGPEMGAGTLVWSPEGQDLDVAVVLEPSDTAVVCRNLLYAGINAAAEALAAVCPPEKPIAARWPDALLYDGGLVGGVRLGLGRGEVPEFVALGLRLRVRGEGPVEALTFLDEKTADYIEIFARCLMLELDLWQARGVASVVDRFRRRSAGLQDIAAFSMCPTWFDGEILA